MTLQTIAPAASANLAPRRRSVRMPAAGLWRASPLTYIALVIAALTSAFPVYWTAVMSSRGSEEITSVPPPALPGGNLAANSHRLFSDEAVKFQKALFNSALVSGTVTISVVLCSALAGFAFAKLRFKGRSALLLVVIGTMMVPTQLGLVPLYMLMGKLHLIDKLPAVILPFLVNGFGVFLMRQYVAQAVPDELIEAARVDGCSTLRIFRSIVFPAVRPAAAILGLFTFMQTWNDFLWPNLVLSGDDFTVQVALSKLSSGYYTDLSLVMTGTAIATAPLLLLFVLFGRQIIGGIMEGAVKA